MAKKKTSAAAEAPKSARGDATTTIAETSRLLWSKYLEQTPAQLKMIDIFLLFLMAIGAIQFGYCLVVGNYPFNAFLAGFSATAGQFVLAVSLRMQSNPENKAEFGSSPKRAFAEFILGSILLHFFCVNFIN